eukprot:CAMPEP_0116996354 /NCGR_PEP_ID=MMETSP0472-20121206/187_1 /TAXON_ID=693140 ORGANISM="Tiarina fusus, Strain LIS" /NCGR_SAMPLE_ID=MMETSP0472 /ASSEMBLY_ACC=CAM_ASM_000603 /LENGTH=186 /DNA_ID=CAMNT_0004694945 /DNA_START=24 /DNA_END=584 /DNA_ORIENTATION=+
MMLSSPGTMKTVTMMTMMSLLLIISSLADAQSSTTTQDEMHRARELAKPWLMRKIEYGDKTLPVTPASVITVFIVVLNILFRLFGSTRWAEANHILIKDSDSAKKDITNMKRDIGNDLKRFQEYASKYSQCPSRAQMGDLGKFKPGAMTTQFDEAVFNPLNATNTTLGPVKTQFGYHLIYIRDRRM